MEGKWLNELRITLTSFKKCKMKADNIIQTKSYAFALRIIKLSTMLQREKSEFLLSKQVLKSETSIGTNLKKAIGGQSDKDFLMKMSIAYK
ncbi:MAG: hypothetical protein OHK0038_10270 [Flammeovirgaceae bacterium]